LERPIMSVLDSLEVLGLRAKDMVALFWQCWAWTKAIFLKVIPFGDAWGYLVVFVNLFISFVRQRKADLLVAARLMREAYQAGDLPVSVWAEVELRVALTVLGTAALVLAVLTSRGRSSLIGAVDTALAVVVLVLLGALVFALPILVLIGMLSAAVSVATWLAYIVWHVVGAAVGAATRFSLGHASTGVATKA